MKIKITKGLLWSMTTAAVLSMGVLGYVFTLGQKPDKVETVKKNDDLTASELPSQSSLKDNQPLLWSFEEGFINYKTDYKMGYDGGIIYAYSDKLKNGYKSSYIEPEVSPDLPRLPAVGTAPVKSYSYKTFKKAESYIKDRYHGEDNPIVKEGDYTFILARNDIDGLELDLLSKGIDMKKDSRSDFKASPFRNRMLEGKGWPTKIIRQDYIKKQLQSSNGIDADSKFWDKYELMQTSTYENPKGERFIVQTSGKEYTFNAMTPEYQYNFINSDSSTALDKVHDFIKNNDLKLKTGTKF